MLISFWPFLRWYHHTITEVISNITIFNQNVIDIIILNFNTMQLIHFNLTFSQIYLSSIQLLFINYILILPFYTSFRYHSSSLDIIQQILKFHHALTGQLFHRFLTFFFFCQFFTYQNSRIPIIFNLNLIKSCPSLDID